MKFFSEAFVENNRPSWNFVIDTLENCIEAIQKSSYSQPLKPYLRFGDPLNRIIAMPAYVGGQIQAAGIKWIASFPDNYLKGLPRAHALIILNAIDTGSPLVTLESNLISAMRTAGVSGLILRKFFEERENLSLGFSGFGFIGKLHFEMIQAIFPKKISNIRVFDQKEVNLEDFRSHNIDMKKTKSWEEAYEESDIFITCTTASLPYISLPPKKNSLHLDVSLRDYQPEIVKLFDQIVVDDWNEVCRENTDIERAHLSWGLAKNSTLELASFLASTPSFKDRTTFFAPMGMASFDISLASAIYQQFKKQSSVSTTKKVEHAK